MSEGTTRQISAPGSLKRVGRALLVAGLFVLPGTETAAAPAEPYEIGRMPALPKEAEAATHLHMFVSPATRRAYQIYSSSNFLAPTTVVTAFDLDTLAPVNQVVVPHQLATLATLALGPPAVDDVTGRIFLPAVDAGSMTGVVVLDEASFAPGSTPSFAFAPAPKHPAYAVNEGLSGVRFEPSTRKLLMVLSPQRDADAKSLALPRGRQPYTTFLAQWDAAPGRVPTEEWAHPVRECSSGPVGLEVGRSNTPFLSEDGRAVRFLCGNGEFGWQFVSLPLGGDGKPSGSGTVQPAPSNVNRILVDPVAQRTHVLAHGSFGTTFDWRLSRTLGTFAVSQTVNSEALNPGIDPVSGRIYVLVPRAAETPGSLLTIDGRLFPLPQALQFKGFDYRGAGSTLVVDPRGHTGHPHVFVRPATNNGFAPEWTVLADPVPLGEPPLSALVDRTADVDEAPGQTERAYAGEAAGYGTRLLVVGGAMKAEAVPTGYYGPCGPVNREIEAGSVNRSTLSNTGAAARADVLFADRSTQADARDLSRCWPRYDTMNIPQWPPAPEPLRANSPGWNAEAAECSGNAADGGGYPGNAHAESAVRCGLDNEKIEARAVYPATSLGAVAVGWSQSSVAMQREDARGIVVRTESVAESVTIDGVGTIGRVHAVAETYARGRRPSEGAPPRSTWRVQLCGVRTATFSQEGCRPPEEAVAALNEAGRGRVVFSAPRPDPDLFAGTPGGYLVGIQKDRGEVAISLVEHGDSSVVLPGLEMQVRNNATTKDVHRYVVQLAGVRSVSVYGISVIPHGTPVDIPTPEEVAAPSPTPVQDLQALAEAPFGLVVPAAAPELRDEAKPPLQRVLEVLREAVAAGWQLFRRTLGDALSMAGIWSTFAVAAYLGVRRRRFAGA